MGHSVATEDNNSRKVTTGAALVFALIIVGLLIATANFVQIMGHSDHSDGHGEAHGTEATHGVHGASDAQGSHGAAADTHAPSQNATEHQATSATQEHAEAAAPKAENAH